MYNYIAFMIITHHSCLGHIAVNVQEMSPILHILHIERLFNANYPE